MITYLILYDPFGYAISPVSLVFVGLTAWLYVRGVTRPSRVLDTIAVWRQAVFLAGLEPPQAARARRTHSALAHGPSASVWQRALPLS